MYNQTRRLLALGEVDIHTMRVMLRDDNTTFNPQHTSVNNLLGLEVSGNGWPQGGPTIPNVNIISDTAQAVLTANDVEITAVGGTIGPASNAVVIDNQNRLLFFYQFIETKEAVVDTPFSFLWSEGEIIRWN